MKRRWSTFWRWTRRYLVPAASATGVPLAEQIRRGPPFGSV